jgi:energy-coupling factor transporter ATP-binding protein EcfA2
MFQGYALFEQMTVADNVGFGLKMHGLGTKERRRRVLELLELMGIDGLGGRRPRNLTAEETYRVALARSLAPRPWLLLLDRPFAGLDPRFLPGAKADLKRWQRELRLPTILVTENPLDALELADRVAVMREGRLEEIEVSSQPNHRGDPGAATRFNGSVTPFSPRSAGGPMDNGNNPAEITFMHESMNIFPLSNPRPPRGAPLVAAVTGYAFKGRSVSLEVRLGEDGVGAVVAPRRDPPLDIISPGALVDLSIEAASGPGRNGHMAKSADSTVDQDF